jgi:hypothetical protein
MGVSKAYAIHRLISRNETKDNLKATEEEIVLDVVDELRLVFESELLKVKDRSNDFEVNFPKFVELAMMKAEQYKAKGNYGYRKLFCLPSFMMGLVMAARIRRHYMHAPWFRAMNFVRMVEVHGGVRGINCHISSRS